MTQDEMTALEQEQQDRMNNDELQSRIIALFEQLPRHRQEALMQELEQILDLGIEEDDDE